MHRGEAMRKLKSIKKQKGKKKVYHVERNNRLFFCFGQMKMLGSKQAQVKRTGLYITLQLKLLPVLTIRYPEICYLFSLLATLAS